MKIHYTNGYNYPSKGKIRFITLCGIDNTKHHNFIHGTIIESRVNCIKCNKSLGKILNEATSRSDSEGK